MKKIMQMFSNNRAVVCATYILVILASFFVLPEGRMPAYLLYVAVFAAGLGLIFLSNRKDEWKSQLLFWLGIAVLGSVMAFRAQSGIDDTRYRSLFNSVGELDFLAFLSSSDQEIGYKLLNWGLYFLTGGNYNIAQAVITFLSFGLWGVAIRSLRGRCDPLVLALLLTTHYYFLVMSSALVRIFIAIPIILYAFHFIWESKWKSYVVCVLLASLFHISALMMLIFVVFAINEKWCYKYWMVLITALLIAMPVGFVVISKVIVPLLGERYAGYANLGEFRLSLGSFDTLPIWLIGVYYCYKYLSGEARKPVIIGIILVSLSMIFSVYSSIVSLGRLTFYANLGILIIGGAVCKEKELKGIDRLIPVVLIAYALVYMVYTGVFNGALAPYLFPYKSFWGTV